MIYDLFPFFNELDLLEIRLNALAPFVDRFVLCEMDVTHSGKPKPLFFEENQDRFKDFPITHIVAPPIGRDIQIEMGKQSGDAWRLEHWQRECLMSGIDDAPGDAIILLSDLDEIPKLETYDGNSEGAFKQKLYYYYVNCFTNTRLWKGTVATKRANISTLSRVRNHRNVVPTINYDGGWHFSTLGTAADIRYKIESFAHTELNKPEYLDKIPERLAKLQDPYGREFQDYPEYRFTIEMPSGPKWLLEHRDRYPHLFHETTE